MGSQTWSASCPLSSDRHWFSSFYAFPASAIGGARDRVVSSHSHQCSYIVAGRVDGLWKHMHAHLSSTVLRDDTVHVSWMACAEATGIRYVLLRRGTLKRSKANVCKPIRSHNLSLIALRTHGRTTAVNISLALQVGTIPYQSLGD